MMSIYDPVMNALLAYLQAKISPYTFLTFRRGIVMWEQLAMLQNGQPIIRQPALFLFDGVGFGGGRTTYQQRGRGRPVVQIIYRTIVLYAQATAIGAQPGGQGGGPVIMSSTPGSGGGSYFHPLIEAVESALTISDSEGTLTLGGLVSHCWLQGDGHLVSPDIDPGGQGMATLPIRIMVP